MFSLLNSMLYSRLNMNIYINKTTAKPTYPTTYNINKNQQNGGSLPKKLNELSTLVKTEKEVDILHINQYLHLVCIFSNYLINCRI